MKRLIIKDKELTKGFREFLENTIIFINNYLFIY